MIPVSVSCATYSLAMNSKHALVRSWLEVLGAGQVPSLETSKGTITAVRNLARVSRDRERRLEVLGDLMRRQAEEYGAEADMMAAGLREMGLAPEQVQMKLPFSLCTCLFEAFLDPFSCLVPPRSWWKCWPRWRGCSRWTTRTS